MDGLIQALGNVLVGLGLPGVIIACLAFAVWTLFKLYSEVQEKRIQEARVSIEAMAGVTTSLNNLTDVVRAGARSNG